MVRWSWTTVSWTFLNWFYDINVQLLVLFFSVLFTCCWCPSYLHLPCNPLTGPGKRVCVESAASVDWPYFWLQAARPWSGACPQRLSLPDLRGRHQAGQHHRPFTQRGMAPTHHHGDKSLLHFYFLDYEAATSSLYLSWHALQFWEHSCQHLAVRNCATQINLGSFWEELVHCCYFGIIRFAFSWMYSNFATFCGSVSFRSQRSNRI